ncbi:MAG: hypothetical protein C0490_02580 [Marivirga sp.]|nr:hypothetical protein [Marivirga sp.]
MKTTNQKLPYRISEYIKDHFREDFLFEVKEAKQKGHWYYTIEVTKDNYIHTLKFDEKGELVRDQADQAFSPDVHEGPTFEEIPE